MKNILLSAIVAGMFASVSFAETVPFAHNVRCASVKTGAKIEIIFDKTQFPDLGRPGAMYVIYHTGTEPKLAALVESSGLAKDGKNKTFERFGPAGQVANHMTQESDDFLNLHADVNFTNYQLTDQNRDIQYAYSFLSELRIKKLSTGEFAARLLDDYGTTVLMFAGNECSVLN